MRTDGESIVNYIKKTAAEEGIDKHVQFHHKLQAADWSSDAQCWTLSVKADGADKKMTAKFLLHASGYYDYENALPSKINGIENFKGTVVHPQFWPSDMDYTGKRIVIIGSGATAVTLLPNLAKTATHVTMLQRSPGYVMARPAIDPLGALLKRFLPIWVAHKLIRLQFLVLPFIFFNFCRAFPNASRNVIRKATLKQLPKNVPHDPHFMPSYNPWEQRMCLSPDGDFYEALREGKTSVVTGKIADMTANSIKLESGETIEADIIVTATGLKMQMAGGAVMSVDHEPVKISEKFLWKGVMLQDLPNAAFVIGYTNASWTLGADATAQLVTRLLNTMKRDGTTAAVPRLEDPASLKEMPVLNLNSTYITAGSAQGALPKAGDSGVWRPRRNYFTDIYNAKYGDINTGLQFYRVST